jgi:hypothetical protein
VDIPEEGEPVAASHDPGATVPVVGANNVCEMDKIVGVCA